MPLRFPTVKSRKKKRAGSQESVASTDPISNPDTIPPVVSDDFMSRDGYVIPKEKDLPKLHRAVWKGDLVKVQQITKNFKKNEVNAVDKEKRTALHLAAARGHRDIIKHLCGLDANVKLCDKDGCTPVHKALESGHCSSLECLLNCGGDANTPDKRGRRPLHLAAYLGNAAATTLLLERDAVLEELDGESNTALHIATLRGHCDLAASLLQDGAYVNATDGKGCTPLMLAAREGRATLVKLLANHEDADPDLTDEDNYKAIDYAITRNHIECAQLIEECEKVKAAEKLRQSQQPRQPSLVDEALIAEVFGLQPPAQKRKEDAPTKSEATPTQSEDPPTQASISDQGWASSEDEDWGSKPPSKVNLKAGLKKAMSASKREPEVAPQPSPTPDPAPKTLESFSSKKETLPAEAPPTNPAQPQHYQLTTQPAAATESDLAPAGELKQEGVESEAEELSIGSGFDSDSISLPLSPLTKPTALPLGLRFMHPDHVTKLEGHMTAAEGKAPVAKDGEPRGKESEELKEPTQQKISATETTPEPAGKNQHGTEQGDETSDFDSDSDSDSTLDMDADLPGFGSYAPSTPGGSPGRAALLKQRRDSDLSLKGLSPKMAASVEKKTVPGPTDTVTSPSAITEVTPMSSGVFSPDVLSGSYPRGKLMLGSPVGDVPELPEESDGEINELLAKVERVEESDGEINELLAKAEKVEKTLLFSEKKEEATGEESNEKREASQEEEKGADGSSSDWDTTESAEEENDRQQKSAPSQPSTSGNDGRRVARSPSARVATARPRRVISNDFGDTDSEDDFEILPRKEFPDKREAVTAPSLTLEAASLHISPRYSSSTLTEGTSTSPANTPRESTIPEKQDPIPEKQDPIPEKQDPIPEKQDPIPITPVPTFRLTHEQLVQAVEGSDDLEQQQSILGHAVYHDIYQLQPLVARKITGMLMMMENSDLLYMLEPSNYELFKFKVEQAADLLRAVNYISDPPRPVTPPTPVAPSVVEAGLQKSRGGAAMATTEDSPPEKTVSTSGESETESEWEREQRVMKLERKRRSQPTDSGLDTMSSLGQATGELNKDVEIPKTVSEEAASDPEKSLGALRSPRGQEGLGVPRTPSEEATSWLKESLGMLKSPRSQPPRCETVWSKQNDVVRIEALMMHVEDPAHKSSNPGHQVPNPANKGSNPGHQVPNPANKGSNPGHQGPNPANQGSNPGQQGPNPANKGSNPGQQVPNPANKGSNPGHQVPNPANKGSNPSHQGPNPANKGSNPGHQGPNPANKGSNPGHQGPNPANKGSNPGHQGPNPANKGSNPGHQGPNPANKGSNPGQQVPNPANKCSNPGHQGPSHHTEQKRRRETTGVSTADPQAANEREEMEEEASRRLYERNNEFLLLVKSKHSMPTGPEGNPLGAGAPRTGRVLLAPIPSPSRSEEQLENPGMETAAGISRGSSKVQLMRQKWENGATLSRQGDMGETSTASPQMTGSKSGPHAVEAQRETHALTAQEALLEQDKTTEVDTQQAAQTPGALPLLEPVPPSSGLSLEEVPDPRTPGRQGTSDASDDEILEVLSASEEEEEGETPPPGETKLPKTVKLPAVEEGGLQVAEAEAKLQITVAEPAQKEEQLQLTASAPAKETSEPPPLQPKSHNPATVPCKHKHAGDGAAETGKTENSGNTPQPANPGHHSSGEAPQPAQTAATRTPKKAHKKTSKPAAQTKKGDAKAKAAAKVSQKEGVSPRAETTPSNGGASRPKTPPPLGQSMTLMFVAPPLGGVSAKTETCHYSTLPVLSSRDQSEATSPGSSTSESLSYTPRFHASALPVPLPMAHSTLTSSQLDTSPLRLQHLALTPSPPHTLTQALEGSGQMRNSQNPSGVLSGSHSLDRERSQSDLSSRAETQSHDPLSASHDPPTESHDLFSEVGNLEDLPFGRMPRLSRSAGNSLLGSAQVSQLQESLREARRGLERNQDALAVCERAKRQLDSQLDDCQRKYDEAFATKLKLESSKLELELQLREMKYSLEQESEGHSSSEAVAAQLREQLNKTEDRLSREIEARQGAELRKREGEIEQRSLTISSQQLQEQVAELSSQLQSERDSRTLQDGLYREQIRMFQSLQEESHRAQKQKTDILSQLQSADTSKHGLEEKLTELHRLNAQLQVDLTSERRRGEDRVTRLEAEVETLKERLQERLQEKVAAEDALLKEKQQFEANLSELRSKAELLSSTLDKEAGERKVAREEVSSLRSRLEQVSRELQEMARKKAEGEQRMSHALEELQRDKAMLQRDLATARENSHQLSGRLEGLSQRMSQGDSEARAQQAALLERTNQIAVLQRELDQRQVKLQAAADCVRREKELVGQLESQLSSLREQLSRSEAECSKLRVEVERAGRRVDEKELSSQQQQQQLSAMFDSLRADSERMKAGLEARQQSLVEQLMSVKEESARKEAESANTLRQLSQLQEEHSSLRAAYSELQETLSATEEAFRELEREKEEEEGRGQRLEERVAALQEELAAVEQNNQSLGEKTAALHTTLAEEQEVKQAAEAAKEGLLDQKAQLESEMASLRGQLVALEGELGSSHRGEGQLRAQVEHLSQIRSDLERTASQLQGEVVGLRAELGEARGVQERASREAEEARCLWEAEVKSRSKLGMKVLEMERSQTDVSAHVEAERKRTRKAMELRRMAEMKFESLHERHAQLQQEAAGLRTQLKVARKQVRQMEANESQLPELRAEFDREQLSLQAEMAALKRQLESTQDQLCRESELRVKADHGTSRARQELEATTTRVTLSQSQSQAKQKELQKLERTNRKLREELRALQDHMATSTVSRAEMETYRSMVEEKAQQELNRKLEEVNHHLAQQSQAQDTLERLRASSESEWKQKLERLSEELRLQLAQALADKRTAAAEGHRFKELYEHQLQKCEKLTGKLQKVKEEAIDSKTKLNLERNRTQHLLNAAQSSAIRVASPIGPHHHAHATSTPLRPSGTVAGHSSTEDLLSSVRMELDRSIARHLDSVPPRAPAPMATRSTYRSTDSILLGPQSKDSHLDAIKRTYHV